MKKDSNAPRQRPTLLSVENQYVMWRVKQLRKLPAPVRFISAEPLLGPLSLDLRGISWVIAGAESGHGARPMDEEWVRGIRDQCIATQVAFFYKQQVIGGVKYPLPKLDGQVWKQFPQVPGRTQEEAHA